VPLQDYAVQSHLTESRSTIVDYIIIGTDHPLQKSDSPDTRLKDLLRSLIETHPVVLIAKEVKTSEYTQTFGRELIGKDKWLSIDMDKEKFGGRRLSEHSCPKLY
jgi:hypothetical protein